MLPGDDEATLAARVLEVEHRCYPLALAHMAADTPTIAGDRVEGIAGSLVLHPLLHAGKHRQ